ncbi:unnamed protein product [Ostreobium quekettii]|uniref:Uncharacterized protein n=1 Tax=Ostreobium quekettii TaxID=121088 RepID=A0A8S1J4P1_9CHLO|nr:unnamed protein product [Ostreobium quekettii]
MAVCKAKKQREEKRHKRLLESLTEQMQKGDVKVNVASLTAREVESLGSHLRKGASDIHSLHLLCEERPLPCPWMGECEISPQQISDHGKYVQDVCLRKLSRRQYLWLE